MKKIYILLALIYSINAHDGMVNTNFAGGTVIVDDTQFVAGLFVDHNNNLLASAFTQNSQGSPTLGSAYRYTKAGTLDLSFNGTGFVELPQFGGAVYILEQPNYQILIIGFDAAQTALIATRLNPDGSFDHTFNGGTPLTLIITQFQNIQFYAAALQPDNKILAIGMGQVPNSSDQSGIIVRLNSDGTVDSTFNSTGAQPGILSFQSLNAGQPVPTRALHVAVQPDGKIIGSFAGFLPNSSPYIQVGLVRLDTDGSFDSTFSSGAQPGIVIIPDPNTVLFAFSRMRVVVQPDAKYLITSAEIVNGNTIQAVLFRVNLDGSLDTSFNGTGKVTLAAPDYLCEGQFIVVEQNGSIILSGDLNSQTTPSAGIFVARYTSSGQIDTTFGTNGSTITIYPNSQQAISLISAASSTSGLYVAGELANQDGTVHGIITNYTLTQPIASTLIHSISPLQGTAQGVSIVQAFAGDPIEVCPVITTGSIWNCSTSLSGAISFQAVAHYPGGNVTIPSCFLPQSTLSDAVRSKYCPCL